MKIIAICGFQGSGKDTLANILIKKYGYKKLSFGGTVKDVASIIFNWDRKMLEGDTTESREWRETVDDWWSKKLGINNLTPRYILQQVGTDLFRNNFHKDIWINCLEKKLIDYDKVVITDCRFPNELKILNKYNFISNIPLNIFQSWGTLDIPLHMKNNVDKLQHDRNIQFLLLFSKRKNVLLAPWF